MAEQIEIKIGADVSQANKALDTVSAKLSGVKRPAADASNALGNLSRIAQDAPFGFIGITNNINPMLESFQRLKRETGSTGAALKAMAGGLTGAGGLGLAVGVVSSLLVVFGDKLFSAKKAADDFAEAISPVQSAITSVSQLSSEIALAKQGFLDKERVVNHFNETIGKTVGQVNSLEEAERSLQANASAFIKMTLLKASAESIMAKAAKESAEARIKALGKEQEAAKIVDKEYTGFARAFERPQQLREGLKKEAQGILSDQEKLNKGYLSLIQNLYKEAAVIGKNNNFDFFGGDYKSKQLKVKLPKTEKIKKELKEKIDALDPGIFRLDVIPYVRESFVGGDVVGKQKNYVLDELLKNIQVAQDAMQQRAQLLGDTISSAVTPAFQSMFDAFTDGKDVFQSFLSGIASGLKSLLTKMAQTLAQALALKAVFSILGVGQIGNIKNGSVGSIFKNLLGFAQGGLVYGPTLGMVGEGRGTTRSNPEVIAPLDKLKNILGGVGSNMQLNVGELRLSGKDLVAAIAVNEASQRRRF